MPSSPARPQRILLVAASAAQRDEVQLALQALDAGHMLYHVTSGDLARSRAEELLPDVILVDEGIAAAHDLIAHLAEAVPDAVLIYLAAPGATEAIADATFAGARSFLAKPVRPEALGRVLGQIAARGETRRGPREDQTRIIVFCAPKGGTGRTSLAVNTALGLLQAGEERVALIDADFAAPAVDVMLNLYPERTIADLLSRLSQLDEALLQGVLATHSSGLRVLMAPPPGEVAARIGPAQIRALLATMGRPYRWILIDLGLPMDEAAYAWIEASDLIVLSVLPEMAGLRNMRVLIDALLERGVDPERLWVVVNRSTIGGGISIRDIEKRLHTDVHHAVPDDQTLATQAVNRGVPVIASHRSGALVRAYRGLVQALLRTLETAEEPRTRRRLFGRGA